MQEFTAIQKARQFIKQAGITAVPVDVSRYAAHAKARIEVRYDLDDDESGQTFVLGGQNIIFVNGNHREVRQRFTILHEIAHIVLGLPSQHGGEKLTAAGLVSYRRRPPEEVLCDVFAAECLLPYDLFKKDVEEVGLSFDVVRDLATRYMASIPSTGSRLATYCAEPCAFVLIEEGVIRYASLSKSLREAGGYIDFGVPVHDRSVAARLIKNPSSTDVYDEIPADLWFKNPLKHHQLVCEEAMAAPEFDQCFALVWLDDGLRRASTGNRNADDDDEPLLKELDGTLPWPGTSKRR